MPDYRVKQGVAKVVFKNRIFRNGKNFIWIRLSRAKFITLIDYWRKQPDFYYMKIYHFDRKTRIVGQQIGFISLGSAELH